MKKALILTVGTGTRPDTDIVRPLVKTVRHSRPDFLAFVVSSISRKYAEENRAPASVQGFGVSNS